MHTESTDKHVVIVGGGFAGLGCARALARRRGVRVTLLDRNNYHQFKPMLYQVATSQLAPADVAFSLRKVFLRAENVDLKLAEAVSIDHDGSAKESRQPAETITHCEESVVVKKKSVASLSPGPQWDSLPCAGRRRLTCSKASFLEAFYWPHPIREKRP